MILTPGQEKGLRQWDNLNTHLEGPADRWTGFNKKHGNKFEFIYTPPL